MYFFRVRNTEPFNFPTKWRKPKRKSFTNDELSDYELGIVASLKHHLEKKNAINGVVVNDPKLMNQYFGDVLVDSNTSIYF